MKRGGKLARECLKEMKERRKEKRLKLERGELSWKVEGKRGEVNGGGLRKKNGLRDWSKKSRESKKGKMGKNQ